MSGHILTILGQQHSTMEHYELLAGDYGDPITGDFTTKLPALCLLHRSIVGFSWCKSGYHIGHIHALEQAEAHIVAYMDELDDNLPDLE